MDKTQKVYKALEACMHDLDGDLTAAVQEGTPASRLHAFYNLEGLREKWLESEYATPLAKQKPINQRKNVEAARNVAEYWYGQFEQEGIPTPKNEALLLEMEKCVSYEKHRGIEHLEAAADYQHEQWRGFVAKHQPERVTPTREQLEEMLSGEDDRLGRAAQRARETKAYSTSKEPNKDLKSSNFQQRHESYQELPPQEQDQDRLVVAVVTDSILKRADIGYEPQIEVQKFD